MSQDHRLNPEPRCLVCAQAYPALGQQVRSPWQISLPTGHVICRRCMDAGKAARRLADTPPEVTGTYPSDFCDHRHACPDCGQERDCQSPFCAPDDLENILARITPWPKVCQRCRHVRAIQQIDAAGKEARRREEPDNEPDTRVGPEEYHMLTEARMDQRDTLAAAALALGEGVWPGGDLPTNADRVAANCYAVADAFLRARRQ